MRLGGWSWLDIGISFKDSDPIESKPFEINLSRVKFIYVGWIKGMDVYDNCRLSWVPQGLWNQKGTTWPRSLGLTIWSHYFIWHPSCVAKNGHMCVQWDSTNVLKNVQHTPFYLAQRLKQLGGSTMSQSIWKEKRKKNPSFWPPEISASFPLQL